MSMKMKPLHLVVLIACIGVAALVGYRQMSGDKTGVWPDPNMTFTLVAGYNPGGGIDAVTRYAQPYLQEYLGIPVVVQNIPGSGGLVGTNSVFAGKSDGYTAICSATIGGIWSYKYLSPTQVPWEIKDWKSTGVFSTLQMQGFVCRKDAPWKDFADLIEDARRRPPKSITVATMGPAHWEDLWIIELQEVFGVEFNWVFYEGATGIQTDLLTGDIDVGVYGILRTDYIDNPEYRVLAAATDDYPADLPYREHFPTMDQFEERLNFKMDDLPAIKIPSVFHFIVKSDIPDDAYTAICEAVKKMCADPRWQEDMKEQSWPDYISPQDAQPIFDEIDRVFSTYQEKHMQYVPR